MDIKIKKKKSIQNENDKNKENLAHLKKNDDDKSNQLQMRLD